MINFTLFLQFQNMIEHASVLLALCNAGGIRTSIEPGTIIYNNLLTMLPFGSTLDLIKVPGKTLKAAFEHAVGVETVEKNTIFRNLLQMSGFKVMYNLQKPVKQRVERVLVFEHEGGTTVYKDLEDEKQYEVVINSFLFKGGDGFAMFKRDHLEHK